MLRMLRATLHVPFVDTVFQRIATPQRQRLSKAPTQNATVCLKGYADGREAKKVLRGSDRADTAGQELVHAVRREEV